MPESRNSIKYTEDKMTNLKRKGRSVSFNFVTSVDFENLGDADAGLLWTLRASKAAAWILNETSS